MPNFNCATRDTHLFCFARSRQLQSSLHGRLARETIDRVREYVDLFYAKVDRTDKQLKPLVNDTYNNFVRRGFGARKQDSE